MDYHIIKDHRRREDQAVIKRQCSPGGAASPAGLLVPDGDGGVISARYPVKIGHPAFELLPGGIAVSFFQGFQTPDLGFRQAAGFLRFHAGTSFLSIPESTACHRSWHLFRYSGSQMRHCLSPSHSLLVSEDIRPFACLLQSLRNNWDCLFGCFPESVQPVLRLTGRSRRGLPHRKSGWCG